MAPIRIKHVVSFSSQDPKHCVDNLCVVTGDGRPWLSSARDHSGVLRTELQLERVTAIHYIDVGNFGSAFIQVDVGRSSWPLDHPYVTLLPTATLMSPAESRQGTGRHSVRMFKKADFFAQATEESWDRLRVTCSQPFNKRIQFGLSFLRLRTAEESTEGTAVHQQGAGPANQRAPDKMQSVKEWLFSPAVQQTFFSQKTGDSSPTETQRTHGRLSRAELMVMAVQSSSSPLQREAKTNDTQLETQSNTFAFSNATTPQRQRRKSKIRQQHSSTASIPKRPRSAACENLTPKGSSTKTNTNLGKKTFNSTLLKTHITATFPTPNSPTSLESPETICPICGVQFSHDYLTIHASSCLDSSSDGFLGVAETEDVTFIDSSPTYDDELLVSCPLCSIRLPADCIQQHASSCGETLWVD